MRRHRIEDLVWREVAWQRQFEISAVWEAFSHLAAFSPRGAIIWESRGKNGQVTHLFGSERKHVSSIEEVFRAHGNIQFHDVSIETRNPVSSARQLKITHPTLSLKTDVTEAVIRAGLAALSEVSVK